MSKSNVAEIIAVLYLIAAILASGYHHTKGLVWTLEFLTVANLAGSTFWAFKERKDTNTRKEAVKED